MTAVLLGVDPGKTGAIAAVSPTGRLEFVEDMPDPLTGATVRYLLDSYLPMWPEKVIIEDAQWRAGQKGLKTILGGWGILVGAFGYAHIPYEIVAANKWKKAMGLTDDKALSRAKACELWPKQADLFRLAKDHNRAEAALLAYWLSEREKHGRWAA